MIFASFSPPSVPWYISEGVFAFLAGLGGMVVSRGLTMEGPPKDGTPREIQGWKLLRFGVRLEVVLAMFFAAREGWFAHKMAIEQAQNNPLNQPISTMTVELQFAVEGSDFSKDPVMPPVAHLMLVESNMAPVLKEGPLVLVSDKAMLSSFVNVSNMRQYSMSFHSDPSRVSSPSFFNGKTAAEIINNVNALEIFPNCIPTNAQILTGQAELYVNGIHKHYGIDMQKLNWMSEADTNRTFVLSGFCLTAKAFPYK